MFRVWDGPLARPTRDVDLLAHLDNAVDKLVAVVDEVCRTEVEPDGILFDARSITGERIIEGAAYEGGRIKFFGRLGNARVRMQLGVGFGDAVVPGPMPIDYPTLLDMPAPRLQGYPRDSVIAEKFEAMVEASLRGDGWSHPRVSPHPAAARSRKARS